MARFTALVVFAAAAVATIRPAGAYEFEVRARTIGQGYDLRALRLFGPDVLIPRRRFVQTLSLSIWDLGGYREDRHRLRARPASGPRIYIDSYLRVEHDFGAWTSGQLVVDNRLWDVVDQIPELEPSSLDLDVLYGFVAAEDLFGGVLDLYLGRQLDVETLDWWSMDGLTARVETPWRFAVEGFGGLRVREASPAGSVTFEPDGTGGADCAEYVEGPVPGSGSWRPIDRPPIGANDDPFNNDFDRCPQREQVMPTWGGALETIDAGPVWVRASYRRSVSPSPGLIGPPDRFEFTDVGYYPNENDHAPEWGTNEERLALTARANLPIAGGKGRITPQLAGRYSLLHGLFDEAHGSVRLAWGAHSLEPELYYSFPTFDGDSIFNVFSIQPYTDARLTYGLAPKGASWRTYVLGWARRFHAEDEQAAAAEVEAGDTAAGVRAGVGYRPGPRLDGRVDMFHEDGYGGRRTGGYSAVRWRVDDDFAASGRVTVVDIDADLSDRLDGLTVGVQAGGTYRFARGVALHLLGEHNSNRLDASQLRLLAVLDLAFAPEQ